MRQRSTTVKDSILEKTREILETGDFSALTMRTIASECNIALGTIYRYFKNKDEILIELTKMFWIEVLENLEDVSYSSTFFEENIEHFYQSLLVNFVKFESEYIFKLKSLSDEFKDMGRNLERLMFGRFTQHIIVVIENDPCIIIPSTTTIDAVAAALCDNLMFSIVQKRTSIESTASVYSALLKNNN